MIKYVKTNKQSVAYKKEKWATLAESVRINGEFGYIVFDNFRDWEYFLRHVKRSPIFDNL